MQHTSLIQWIKASLILIFVSSFPLMEVNHSVTYMLGWFQAHRSSEGPISAPNGTEKWVSGIVDAIFVFLGEMKRGRLHICGCEDCDSLPFSSSPHSTELMTAALSCYGPQAGETVVIVNEVRGITVLNPQMEFYSLSRWNNLVGFLSLHTAMSFSFFCFQSLAPPNPFIFVLKIVFCFCVFELFYSRHWEVAGKIWESRGQWNTTKSLSRFWLTFKWSLK